MQKDATIRIGDNIWLEIVDDQHVEPIYSLVDANRRYLEEWLPWVAYMQSQDFIEKFVEASKQQFSAGTDIAYVVVYDGEVIGRIGIYKIDRQNRIGAIGYWIAEQYQGKGIITSACKGLIDFCFSSLGLNRIEIKCGTNNQKSRKIPERLGFTHEGIIRQGELAHGGFIDLHFYSLLKEEWRNG